MEWWMGDGRRVVDSLTLFKDNSLLFVPSFCSISRREELSPEAERSKGKK